MSLVREPQKSEILIYQTADGRTKIDVRLDEETVWLTKKLMAQLFQVKPQNITMHLKNIYLEGELNQEATCKKFLQVQPEGGRKVERKQKFYNFDAIISVGYRIKSQIATQFRIWATQRLKDWPNGQGWTKWTEGMDGVGVSLCGGFVGFAENN